MGMKLTGEYEIVSDGVLIAGKVHDTQIARVRKILEPAGDIMLCAGKGEVYGVPSQAARTALIRSGLLLAEHEKKFVPDVERCHPSEYISTEQFFPQMGVIYSKSYSQICHSARIGVIGQRDKIAKKLITQSAWVWNVDEDGRFSMRLKGITNRHIMTLVLDNAVKMARYIDEVVAPRLSDADNVKKLKDTMLEVMQRPGGGV